MPPAALLRGFKRFLQPHTRCCKQARARLVYWRLRKLGAELLHHLEFARARLASRDMLLQFVTSVVGQLVIKVENDVLLNPFALHSCLMLDGRDARRSTISSSRNSSQIRQRPPQFLGCTEERVFGCFFRGIQDFTDCPQLQSVIMLQLEY